MHSGADVEAMMQHGSASSARNKEQQVDSSHKHNQPQAHQKDVQTQHNFFQKSGFQISKQNSTRVGDIMRQPKNHNKQVLFAKLLSVIEPHIDKDRAMQVQTLYSKLKKQEIHKDGFLRYLRSIVGDQMIIQAVQMQGQSKAQAASNSQKLSHQHQQQSQNSSQQQQQQSQEQHLSQIPATLKSSHSLNQGNPAPTGTNSMPTQQLDSSVAVRTQVPSMTALIEPGTNIKTAPQKPTIGQKKPLDHAVGTQLSLASKKQKVSGAFLDKSIEQLNDVTTVGGIDLREEEEQLFRGSKKDTRAFEATRRVVQEKEEKLILQKKPLQKKLSKIMSKCGIKNMSKDVERCLSLCLEERMRGLISSLIRVSKQRVDVERSRHRTTIASNDVRQQILVLKRKAKEDWDKKQAEKLHKTTEVDRNTGADSEKDKDEGRSKKEEEDKMRTTAANVAARVAIGGADIYSKWQLAKQAQQKCKRVDSASFAQTSKDIILTASSLGGRTSPETHDGENRSSSAAASGGMRKSGRKPVVMPHTKNVRTISVKDVLAILEREPQMSKSTLVHRLYVMSAYGHQTADEQNDRS